jgi:4'-phosphopantetheinyl transferase
VGLDELEPCFTNDAATVWLLDLAEAPGPADLELLGPGERRRLARYADQRDAERYGAAHVGLRRLVARYLGVEPADVVIGRRPCPACASPEHGPPDIVAPHTDAGISLSRSGEHALVGIARAGAIGVDLEEVRDFDFGNVAPTVLSLAEQRYVHAQPPAGRGAAFYRCWVRKEAVAKGCGVGIVVDLPRLHVAPGEAGPVEVRLGATGGDDRWCVRDLALGPGLAGALATPIYRASQN